MKLTLFQTLLTTVLFYTCTSIILQSLPNEYVLAGNSTRFYCASNETHSYIVWKKEIYRNGRLQSITIKDNNYHETPERMQVLAERDEDIIFSYIEILNVTFGDGLLYSCSEKFIGDTFGRVENVGRLVILEPKILCSDRKATLKWKKQPLICKYTYMAYDESLYCEWKIGEMVYPSVQTIISLGKYIKSVESITTPQFHINHLYRGNNVTFTVFSNRTSFYYKIIL